MVEYLPWLTAAVGIILLILIPYKIVAFLGFLIVTVVAVVSYDYADKARHRRHAALVTVTAAYDAKKCGEGSPLSVMVNNGSGRTVSSVSWNIAAHAQGDTVNLVWHGHNGREWDRPYSTVHEVGPGESVRQCLGIPALQTSLYPQGLQYKATYKEVAFGR